MARKATSRLAGEREPLRAGEGDPRCGGRRRAGSDYGGAGRFWERRREAEGGARLRRRDDRAGAARPRAASRRSRSARSGLIRGLRGVAPFDGARFPPLPWGGTRVADADIAFIADWIDDGLPEDHRQTIDLGTLEAKGGKVAHLKLADVAEFARRDRRATLCLSRRRAAPAPEPRLPRRAASSSGCAQAFRTHLRSRRARRGPAQLQQPGADPSEPLPARLGAVPALASRLSLRVRAEPAGLRAATSCSRTGTGRCRSTGRTTRPTAASFRAAFKAFLTTGGGRRADRRAQSEAEQRRRPMAFRAHGRGRRPMLFVSQHDFFCYVIGNDRLHGGHARSGGTRTASDASTRCSRRTRSGIRCAIPAEYAGGGTINKVIHYHYPTADDIAQILSLQQLPRLRRRQRLRRRVRLPRPEPAQHDAHLDRRHEPRCRSDDGSAELRVRRGATATPRRRRASARRAAQRPTVIAGRKFHHRDDLLLAAAVRRHVHQPDRVLRPDLLADPRQCRPALVGMADSSNPDRPAGRSRLRAVAVELHDPRHARHLALRLRVRALLATSCRSAWRRRSAASSRSRSRSTQARRTSARPRCGCTGCRSCCAPASCASSSTSRTPTPRRRCATIRTTPATSRSSATANATAVPAIATCRRRARAPSTCARAATTRRATIASTSPRRRERLLETSDDAADHAGRDRRRLPRGDASCCGSKACP